MLEVGTQALEPVDEFVEAAGLACAVEQGPEVFEPGPSQVHGPGLVINQELAAAELQRLRPSTLDPLDRLAGGLDRKSTRLNSSHIQKSRMPSSA